MNRPFHRVLPARTTADQTFGAGARCQILGASRGFAARDSRVAVFVNQAVTVAHDAPLPMEYLRHSNSLALPTRPCLFKLTHYRMAGSWCSNGRLLK